MNQTVHNKLMLCGEITSSIEYSHESHGEIFYCFTLKTKRLSGIYDYINVLVNEQRLKDEALVPGCFVEIEGELRSFNKKNNNGNHLIISAFAKELRNVHEGNANCVSLCGVICKEPVYRKTPLGREICDIMLAINRKYGRSDYIPCIIWGKNAYRSSELKVGTEVSLTGRIQSRNYIKKTEDSEQIRTTYEVSVSAISS